MSYDPSNYAPGVPVWTGVPGFYENQGMTLAELQAAAAPGHVCNAECVEASKVECGCSAAPTTCEECEAFFAQHPKAV